MRMKFLWLAVLAATVAGSAGCIEKMVSKPEFFANTNTAKLDGFDTVSPQWAYEGEPVTFDFAPAPQITDYAVFTWSDGKSDYLDKHQREHNLYRVIRSFKAAAEPKGYEVEARSFVKRNQNDWYLDRETGQAVMHLTKNDVPDDVAGRAKMAIICYRVAIDIELPAEKGLADVTMTLVKDDGTETVRRMKDLPEEVGVTLVGPDARGVYRVQYTPTWKEVSRTGQTTVKVLATGKDGAQRQVIRQIDTP